MFSSNEIAELYAEQTQNSGEATSETLYDLFDHVNPEDQGNLWDNIVKDYENCER